MRINRFWILFAAIIFASAAWAQTASEPVNPHATPEARALLAYLNSISGKAVIAGQHNYPYDGTRWTDLANNLSGKYPGLYGEDFGFSAGEDKDSVLSRPTMIEEVKRQYKSGAVIALTWHEVRPTDDEPVTFHDSVQGHLTDSEWQQLLTPGTPIYNRWCAQVDVVAGYLGQLRDAHIPVLYRPYHEINGNWFWWTGRPGKDGSAALYRQLYDRFVNVHHLDNLVWVWNVNAPNPGWPPVAEYYPGANYADVISMDIYSEFKQEYYDSMLAVAAGKPIALAEVGGLPSPEVLAKQPRWTYFMAWSELVAKSNSVELLKSVYHAPQILGRDDPRLSAPMEAIRKATADRTAGAPGAEPVTPSANAEAKALLTRLAAGQGVLSGQINDLSLPVSAAVLQATGRQPAIFAAELETASSDALVKELIQAHANQQVVSLSWRPARPTDNAPADPKNQLTDFEWAELLTPSSALNQRWATQVDQAAATLRELEKAGIAVLWNPYPESNGKDAWWAGRKGVNGSAALYRQLFYRLVNHDGLHNLLWVWEAAPPSFGPGGPGPLSDFFPGLLYADALELRVNDLNPYFPAGRFLAQAAVGKVIGVELKGNLPAPEVFAGPSEWAWFLAAPQAIPAPGSDALRKLYADPHVVSLAPAQGR